MRVDDYLSSFSVEDLRELAARRGIPLSAHAQKGRQTMVRTLAAALGRYDTLYTALARMNQAELLVLTRLIAMGRRASLSGLQAVANVSPQALLSLLEELRLWGVVFPEGDWEHIVFPHTTHLAPSYLDSMGVTHVTGKGGGRLVLAPPRLDAASAADCRPRPGSFDRDLAELLARVARARLRITQSQRINKRDLKAMEPGLEVRTAGYSFFVYMLAVCFRILIALDDVLAVTTEADTLLGQDEETRARLAIAMWSGMLGYPETSWADPTDVDYVSEEVPIQRTGLLRVCAELPASGAVTVASIGDLLGWLLPAAFRARACHPAAVGRLCRSLYWLGLLQVDDPEAPTRVSRSRLALRLMGPGDGPPGVPEESRFYLQPNAEIFAPPNLSPRTFFHLRRLTGEKKGGAAGTFPLTGDSLRRGLDSGLTAAEIAAFLTRYSRTGLPDNVRALVETAGRQHGRIRLVPADYVLLTDEPALMDEIRSLKAAGPLVGMRLTDRAACVDEESAADLLRLLRARGYAPQDLSDAGDSPPLPQDPDAPPPALPAAEGIQAIDPAAPGPPGRPVFEDGRAPVDPRDARPAPPVTSREAILELLSEAGVSGIELEIEFRAHAQAAPEILRVQPYLVDPPVTEVVNTATGSRQRISISCIRWARPTGREAS